MTRHELKDGKWYLIKDYTVVHDFRFNKHEYENYFLCKFESHRMLSFPIGDLWEDHMKSREGMEWVEIDPELAFNLFKDQVKLKEYLII